MVPKGPGCRGCPFETKGRWMVPDEYRPVPVLVLGDAPGEHEERGERLVARAGKLKTWEACDPAPFLGDDGHDLDRTYLPLAGLVREDVSLATVIRCRVGGSRALPPLGRKEVQVAIRQCQGAYFRPQTESRVVVALGQHALWAVSGEDGGDPPPHGISRTIAGWRGWVLPWSPFTRQKTSHVWSSAGITGVRGKQLQASQLISCVYATLPPVSIYAAPWLKPAVLRDWQKLGELLAGRWPQSMPPIQRAMTVWPREFAFDTEFWSSGERREQRLVRYSASDGAEVWVVEAGTPNPHLPQKPPSVVMHHADSDIDQLEEFLGGVPTCNDTLYAHHALHAELAHDLDFLGSLYARTNRWKHLSRTNPVEYSAGDALGTWDVWQGLRAEFARDPQSEWVYRNTLLPLLTVVGRSRRVGPRVAQGRAQKAVSALREAQQSLLLQTHAAAGWPMNLKSAAHVAAQGYGVERWR